jgi:hypothetical protein
MKFKSFLTEVSYKHKKDQGTINLETYKGYCQSSTMPKKDVKEVSQIIHNKKGELPVLHENTTFYMVDVSSGKTRPVKSRHDKIAVGTILNGMVMLEENEDKQKALKEMPLGWDIPSEVFKKNR